MKIKGKVRVWKQDEARWFASYARIDLAGYAQYPCGEHFTTWREAVEYAVAVSIAAMAPIGY